VNISPVTTAFCDNQRMELHWYFSIAVCQLTLHNSSTTNMSEPVIVATRQARDLSTSNTTFTNTSEQIPQTNSTTAASTVPATSPVMTAAEWAIYEQLSHRC